jgi:hypothetical protein
LQRLVVVFCLASFEFTTFERMSLGFSLLSHWTSYPAVDLYSCFYTATLFAVRKLYNKALAYYEKVLSYDGGTPMLRAQCLANMREMKERLMGANVSEPVILHRKMRYCRGCQKTTRKSHACAICLYVYYCNAGVCFVWFVTFAGMWFWLCLV